ncbi:MAG: hypothetical protein KDE20_01865 [Caldilineaceae bacterium]|nr:hypothetical protein [Caldilineaceae bacterium]
MRSLHFTSNIVPNSRAARLGYFLLLLMLAALPAACGQGDTAEPAPAGSTATSAVSPAELDADVRAVATTYADIVYATYADTLADATALQTAVDTFVAAPSEETLAAAKQAWLAARESYGQSEAFRFYGGPIDDADGPEGLLNAWPLDEAYIDYVEGAPDAGIINNVADYPEITQDLLISLNEVGAEENISTGYHAIEFLLWGQDLRADGSGERPYTDYVEGGAAANPVRRGQYLTVVADLLVQQLSGLVAAWDPAGTDTYRAEFLALPTDDVLQKMLTGIGVLSKSELAGERIFTAYDNQDQEDEHSCFSDNTHRDIIANAQGIANVYLGRYVRPDGSVVEGAGLRDIVAAVDPDLNAELVAMLDSTLAHAQAIHVPFDQAIVRPDTRPAVLETVYALQDQGDKFAQVAHELGVAIDTALPE